MRILDEIINVTVFNSDRTIMIMAVQNELLKTMVPKRSESLVRPSTSVYSIKRVQTWRVK